MAKFTDKEYVAKIKKITPALKHFGVGITIRKVGRKIHGFLLSSLKSGNEIAYYTPETISTMHMDLIINGIIR